MEGDKESEQSNFQETKRREGQHLFSGRHELTQFALETLRLCNLVDANQRSVSDMIQDRVENGRLGVAIVRSRKCSSVSGGSQR